MAVRPTSAQEMSSSRERPQEDAILAEQQPATLSLSLRQTRHGITRLAQPRLTAAAVTRLTAFQKQAKVGQHANSAVLAETRSLEAALKAIRALIKEVRLRPPTTYAKTAKPIAEADTTAAVPNGELSYAAAPCRPTTGLAV